MKLLPVFAAALLAGCGVPAPTFWDVEPVTVTHGEWTWRLHRKGDQFSALAENYPWFPSAPETRRAAAEMIRAETGCEIDAVTLNQHAGMVEGYLTC